VETNKDESVKAAEESDTKAEEESKQTEEIEEASRVEEPEEIEKTLEAPETPEEVTEEAKLEELPEEEAVEEEAEEITREAEEVLEEKEIVEEEERREIEKREEIEEEIVEERIYTIPLRRAWISPRKKRTPRAVRLVKAFIQRHMKPEALVMSNEVNERLWSRSIQKPPRKIRVRAVRDKEGTVTLYLAEGD
jgi:large subunit ribosomal protein L31e